MDYYGLLFLYYLKGLSGKSILRLFFNIEVGGTEQLLPENTSVPTTTPILADIQYPDGLRTDQYFTYRETPTTVSNKARIKTIKGNTLVWNQLAQNGNFADGVGQWTTGGANTLTVTNGVCKIQSTNTSTNNHHLVFPDPSIFQNGHKYLLRCEARAYGNMIGGSIFFAQQTDYINIGTLDGLESLTSAWQSGYLLFNRNDFTLTNGKRIVIGSLTTVTTDDYFELKNICVFDLTQMGLDSLTNEEVLQWFADYYPLDYYSYNAGTLLSFNGTGIKTIGKNRASGVSQGSISPIGETVTNNTRLRIDGLVRVSQGKRYVINGKYSSTLQCYLRLFAQDGGAREIDVVNWHDMPFAFTVPAGVNYVGVILRNKNSSNISPSDVSQVQFEEGSEATSYEPYTTSTTSLPVSTYFPTGMKSAGTVYDELTPTKAITRVGMVDMGTISWAYNNNSHLFQNTSMASSMAHPSSSSVNANILCVRYSTVARSGQADIDKSIAMSTAGTLLINDTSYNAETITEFRNSLNGIYLYYELAEYQETPITTEDANEALSLLMGKSVSSDNANQLIDIITKGE